MGETTVTVASLIESVGTVFTAVIGYVGEVAVEIAAQPILLMACVAVPLCGIGVAMFKRLLSSRV